jgi:hypothetical protein
MSRVSVVLLVVVLLATLSDAARAQTIMTVAASGAGPGSPVTTSAPPAVVTNHRPLMTGGSVEGSVWQLQGEPVTLSGPISITQDLLLPGTPTVTTAGSPTFGGVVDGTGNPLPSGYAVTLGGQVSLGHLIDRTDPFGLGVVPDPPSPKGTRSVKLTTAGQSPGDFATLRHLALSGTAGAVAVPPGTYGTFLAGGSTAFVLGVAGSTQPSIYNLQILALTDRAQLRLVGPVILTIADGVAAAKSSVLGTEADPTWLSLRLSRTGLVLTDSSALHGVVRAPSAAVSLFGSARLNGAVFCNQLIMAGRSAIQVSVVNHAPSVSAGASYAVTLPVASVYLGVTSSDDGLPAGISTYQWTQVSGPAAAAFGAPTSSSTSATFAAPGVYDLRLTASDGQLSSTSDFSVTVNAPAANAPPVVTVGPNQTITLPSGVTLTGTVTDDGLPAGSSLTTTWSVTSGPGPVTFGTPTSPATTATFSEGGIYVLRLTASDGVLTAQGDVAVTVQASGPLAGAPDTPVRQAVGDVFVEHAYTDADVSVDAVGRQIVRQQLKILFRENASVGQVNDLLNRIGATVTGSIAGTRGLVVRIPDPGSLAALDAVVYQIEADPSVWFVRKGIVPTPDALPSNVAPTSIGDLSKVDHHLAVKAHAAWNAAAAIGSAPNVAVIDDFGGGAPDPTFLSYLGVNSDFHQVLTPPFSPDDHGYHVLGIISGSFGGDASDRGHVTGMNPGPVNLRVGDLTAGLYSTIHDLERLTIERAAAFPSGNVVISTSQAERCSLSGPDCRAVDEANREAVDWIEMVRARGLEARALHVTSAGNRDTSTRAPFNASVNSSFASSALLSPLTNDVGAIVPGLTNTLVIENARETADHTVTTPPSVPFGVRCVSSGSYVGGNLSAIGSSSGPIVPSGSPDHGVWSFTATGAGEMSGTSMATPQIAGLAAYLWSIDQTLSPQQLVSILTTTANPVPILTDADCSSSPTAAPSIDAYAAVLALDSGSALTSGNLNLAKVRVALLDVANAAGLEASDGRFDENDIALLLAKFAQPASLDYSRFDLNGDGFTGGATTARFDLDINNPPAWTTVSQTIAGQPVSFNEKVLTDMDVLCYYAVSPLYTGDPALRDLKMAGQCGRASKIAFNGTVSDPANVDIYVVNPDGTGLARLTTDPGIDTDPAWSFDGSRIAFVSTRASFQPEIFVMQADGSGVTRLSGIYGSGPRWSPDGTRITFVYGSNIYVVHADGSAMTKLTNARPGYYYTSPDWSPDGTRIAFASNAADVAGEIFTMNPDGSGVTNLTQALARGLLASGSVMDSAPSWSPDGSKIAFLSSRANPAYNSSPLLFVMNSDGSGQTRLTDPFYGGTDYPPMWSPDGRIAFVTARIAATEGLYAVDPNGSGLTMLFAGPFRTASWSRK